MGYILERKNKLVEAHKSHHLLRGNWNVWTVLKSLDYSTFQWDVFFLFCMMRWLIGLDFLCISRRAQGAEVTAESEFPHWDHLQQRPIGAPQKPENP